MPNHRLKEKENIAYFLVDRGVANNLKLGPENKSCNNYA